MPNIALLIDSQHLFLLAVILITQTGRDGLIHALLRGRRGFSLCTLLCRRRTLRNVEISLAGSSSTLDKDWFRFDALFGKRDSSFATDARNFCARVGRPNVLRQVTDNCLEIAQQLGFCTLLWSSSESLWWASLQSTILIRARRPQYRAHFALWLSTIASSLLGATRHTRLGNACCRRADGHGCRLAFCWCVGPHWRVFTLIWWCTCCGNS